MVDDNAPAKVDEEGSPVCVAAAYEWTWLKFDKSLGRTFVNTDQNVPVGTEGDGSNIFAVLESKGEGLVAVQRTRELFASAAPVWNQDRLYQIKDRDPIAHRTEYGIPVGCEYNVSLLIHCTA